MEMAEPDDFPVVDLWGLIPPRRTNNPVGDWEAKINKGRWVIVPAAIISEMMAANGGHVYEVDPHDPRPMETIRRNLNAAAERVREQVT